MAKQHCYRVGEPGKERKLVPRDPGKGFIPEELCGLKGTKGQGNSAPYCVLSGRMPLSAWQDINELLGLKGSPRIESAIFQP